jgi:16S rRNA (cytosine967-C5)-methyltransferase
MILRLGLYQIIFMDRVPSSAAVSESVELAKKYGHKGTAGMTNAILRRFSEERDMLLKKLDLWDKNDISTIAAHTSHPEWLVKRYVEQFGFKKGVEILKANNESPPQSFRVRDWDKLQAEANLQHITIEKSLYSDLCVSLDSDKQYNIEKLKYEKVIIPQDQSSLIAASLMAGAEGRVLELCCGRGNKTESIIKYIDKKAVIFSIDLSVSKLRHLLSVKIDRVNAICCDVIKPLPFIGKFEYIFLDAPCTNLGTIRRHPEIRYRKSEPMILSSAATQLAALNNAAGYLKKGGRILYAVCSVEREETVGVVEKFLSANSGFSRVDIASLRPDLAEAGLTTGKDLLILPGSYGMDGFFASLIRRDGD